MRAASHPADLVGLDIGSSEIKFTITRELDDDYSVVAYGRRPVPAGTIVSGQIANSAALVKALQELVREYRLENRQVNFSIASPDVRLEQMTLSIIEGIDEDVQIAGTAEAEFEPGKNTVLDYARISQTARELEVQLVIADRRRVLTYVEALKKAKLRPYCCEYAPVAEARSLVVPRDPRGRKVHLVANIGAEKTLVSVRNGALVTNVSTIAIGGDEMTNAAAKALAVPVDEAEQVKQTVGLTAFSHPDPNVLEQISRCQEAMQEVADRLVTELVAVRRTVEQNSLEPVGLIVIGGGGRLTGLPEQLSRYVDLPLTGTLKPRDGLEEAVDFDLYATAYGLSAETSMSLIPRSVKGALPPKLDLKKAEEKARKLVKTSPATNPALIGVLVGLLLLVGCYWYGNHLRSGIIGTPAPPPPAQTTSATQVPSYTGSFGTPLVNQLADLVNQQGATSFLNSISRLTSSWGVHNTKVVVNSNTISYQGEVADQSTFTALQNDVKALPGFLIASASGTVGQDGLFEFTINLTPKAQ